MLEHPAKRHRCWAILARTAHILLTFGIAASAFAQLTELHAQLFVYTLSSILYVVCYVTLILLSLIFYCISSFMDPGFVPIPAHVTTAVDSDDENLEADPERARILASGLKLRHCGFCGIDQPLRARHCEECRQCVRCFDHHCPWLGTCVGELNHRYFLFFLLFTASAILWNTYIIWKAIHSNNTVLGWLNENCLFVLDLVVLLPAAMTVVCLAFIHIYAAFCNITTWEFVSRQRISYLRNTQSNPFHQGYFKNFVIFLCACGVQSWEQTWEKFAASRRAKRKGRTVGDEEVGRGKGEGVESEEEEEGENESL